VSRHPLAAAILAVSAPSALAGGGYRDETVAILAERRLAVAALTALLLKNPGYRLIAEARGTGEVREALVRYRPAVMVESQDSPFASPFVWAAIRLVVDPEDHPDVFLSAVYAAIAQARADSVDADAPRLSEREREILAQIASGRSTKEVARDCAISPKTVGNHISNICQKLNFHTRGQLVLFAMEQGLTSVEPAPA
jgi:DNA-binding CsgD family transcriptional regulator